MSEHQVIHPRQKYRDRAKGRGKIGRGRGGDCAEIMAIREGAGISNEMQELESL